ncbi:MAG TPA: MFS transporter [Candidatus Polarisedimenticolia bacterium]|nr:MFS transporter [Candidatus Polarisedimenticolia bacterium]
MTSWRTASVALLSFSSGMPLGLVWIAIPDWLRSSGVDLRVVGMISLAQAPWSFKVLWSPLVDRFSLPWLGRRRGWVALAQLALLALGLCLAGVGDRPDAPWIIGALALAIGVAAATHDIAYDAYTVEVLRPEEQGLAVGAKTALYRAAMYAAGGLSITAAGAYSWPAVNVVLALMYVPLLIVTWKAPEPPDLPLAPRSLKEAVWEPFVGFLARHRALEILAFVFFYKFADNLAVALLRPFLVDMGYGDFDRGVALATVGLAATITGTLLGGILTTTMGLGHALWIFGFLQIFSNAGYVLVARSGVDRVLMYGATGFDNLTSGLASGAFAVLLLRLTQRRFSATQYALFSSLFGLPRIVAGPITGFAVTQVGWEAFFWISMIAGIPGMLLLQRFVPVGVREPGFETAAPRAARRLRAGELTWRGCAGGVVAALLGLLSLAALDAMRGMRLDPGTGFDLLASLARIANPADGGGWLRLLGLAVTSVVAGLCTAAIVAARSGGSPSPEGDEAAGR